MLRLLYVRRDGLGFIQEPLPPQERQPVPLITMGLLTAHFEEIRELCIDILQDRTMPLPDRMLLLGRTLQDLVACTRDNRPDIPAWLAQRRRMNTLPELRELVAKLPSNQEVFIKNNVKQLLAMPNHRGNVKALHGMCCPLLEVEQLEGNKFKLNTERYKMAEESVLQTYGDLEYFFENMMVNVFFQGKYPLVGLTGDILHNYIYLCNLYATLRFMMVCGCYGHSDLDRLFHVLTITARIYLHSNEIQKLLVDEFMRWENTGLGDMAILVRG